MFTGYLLEQGFEKAGEEGTVFCITSQTTNNAPFAGSTSFSLLLSSLELSDTNVYAP